MIAEKLQKEINEQVVAEMWSANLYLSMSLHMARAGYCGMAHWLKKQWEEENTHAWQMADYITQRGGKAVINKVDVVPVDFGTPLEIFEQVYSHECRVSGLIDKLVDSAIAAKDKATEEFLRGFVREQMEEESTASGIVDKLKLAGTTGLLYVDQQLGMR
ncbi:MAG: ferritin [Prevotellaceae bacterium]|jgi:ferritin|nr:ferritin [Prevotellaceae bacterium]